jgi:hypothetical protein
LDTKKQRPPPQEYLARITPTNEAALLPWKHSDLGYSYGDGASKQQITYLHHFVRRLQSLLLILSGSKIETRLLDLFNIRLALYKVHRSAPQQEEKGLAPISWTSGVA